MGKAKQKLVGYVRLSSQGDREDERFHSPDLQREAIERFAATRYGSAGYEFVEWFQDIDRSGTTQKRAGLDKAKQVAIAEHAHIVVFDLSRWGRNISSDLTALQELEEHGVELVSASDGIDNATPGGSFARMVLMAAAEMQANVRSEGWRSVIENAKRSGRWHGSIPLGYRRANSKEAARMGGGAGLIVPDKRVAPVVRKAFHDYATGTSMYEIGVRLVKLGHYARPEGASVMLRNPVYVGLVRVPMSRSVRRGVQEDVAGEVLTDSHGRKRYRYDDVEFVKGRHEPLIDEATWDKVRARDNKERAAREARRQVGGPINRAGVPSWWGAGIVRCGGCGATLTRSKKPNATYLICQGRRAEPCPRVASVRLDALEPLAPCCPGPGPPRHRELAQWPCSSPRPALPVARRRRADRSGPRVGARGAHCRRG